MDSKIKEYKINKYLRIEMILFFAIRCFLLFIEHLYGSFIPARNMLKGVLPYCSFEKLDLDWDPSNHIFPPLFYYLYFLEYIIFGNLIEFIHPLFLIFDFLNFYLVIKMKEFFHQDLDGLIAGAIVIVFPISIIFLAFIEPSIYACTFLLASLYFFLKERNILSSVSAAFGTAILFLPAVVILPILFYFFRKRDFYSFLVYLFFFFITLVVVCLPFLILCPKNFINSLNFTLNTPQSSNLGYIVFGNIPQIELFNLYGIGIKILNIFQVFILLVSISYFYRKYKIIKKKNVLLMTIFYIYLIMVLTLYIHPRFLYWAFLIIVIVVPYNKTYEKRNFDRIFKKYVKLSIPFIFLSIFCLFFSRNFSLYKNEAMHMNLLLFYLFLFNLLWVSFGFLMFKDNAICMKMILYNAMSVFGFILYKLFYDYFYLYMYHIGVSYFVIVFIIYISYFLSFRFYYTISNKLMGVYL